MRGDGEHWIEGYAYGDPFDAAVAETAMGELEEAGLWPIPTKRAGPA